MPSRHVADRRSQPSDAVPPIAQLSGNHPRKHLRFLFIGATRRCHYNAQYTCAVRHAGIAEGLKVVLPKL